MGLEQKTVNLVVVIGVIVIAAGAWSAPLLTAQTVHTTLSADIDDAVTSINTNTDSETGELGTGFFGSGTDIGDSFGDCTMFDMLISIALDENIQQLCDPSDIDNFIKSDIHFDDFKDQFEVSEQFLELRPMNLIPDRDCADNDLTDSEIFIYANTAGAAGDRQITSGAGAGTFGTVVCIHQFSFEESPQEIKTISVEETGTGDAKKIRLQLAVIDDTNLLDGAAPCGGLDTFGNNTVYDGFFNRNDTISADFMIPFPPNGNANLCARTADEQTVTNNYATFISVQDIVPINILNFIPEFQFFEFDHFAPVNATNKCTISLHVTDTLNNNLNLIPIVLLDPFVTGKNGPGNRIITDANGDASFGANMPSSFYVIDVNVPDGVVVTVSNFGPAFPDQQINCQGNAVGGVDGIDGIFTIEVDLPIFGGANFAGATVEVFAENTSTGQAIAGIDLKITGTDPFGNALTFTGGVDTQTTDSFGEAEFDGLTAALDGLPGGEYTITFTAANNLQGATTVIFIPPGASGFFDVFLPISPT